MQVQTPRKASTMAHRVLETSLPSSQKGKKSHSSPTCKHAFHSHCSLNPLCSSLSSTHSHRSLNPLRSSSPIAKAPSPAQPHSQHVTAQYSEMLTIITTALRNWLTENGLQGYIQVAEAPPHPNVTEIASRINIETITDSMLRKKLNLDCTCEWQLEMVPPHILERYYGKYSLSAKAFRTKDIPDPFFRDVAKFLLEVGCVHVNAYGMPKHKARVVLATYEGTKVDWGIVAGAALREGLHTF